MKQYYHETDGCPGGPHGHGGPQCICWHNQGEGPYYCATPEGSPKLLWRDKPEAGDPTSGGLGAVGMPDSSGCMGYCADAPPSETQVGGDHYTKLPIQPFAFIQANGLGFAEGNVVKYVTRWRDKGGVEDLKKARHYLDLLIEHESKKSD